MKVSVQIPAIISVVCEVEEEDRDKIWEAAIDEYMDGDYYFDMVEDESKMEYEVQEEW